MILKSKMSCLWGGNEFSDWLFHAGLHQAVTGFWDAPLWNLQVKDNPTSLASENVIQCTLCISIKIIELKFSVMACTGEYVRNLCTTVTRNNGKIYKLLQNVISTNYWHLSLQHPDIRNDIQPTRPQFLPKLWSKMQKQNDTKETRSKQSDLVSRSNKKIRCIKHLDIIQLNKNN